MRILIPAAFVVASLSACAGGIPTPPPAPSASLDPADLSNPQLCAEIVKAEGWLDYFDAWGKLAGYDVRARIEATERYADAVEARDIVCVDPATDEPVVITAEALAVLEAE